MMHHVNNHGVSRGWFSESDVKNFKSGALRTVMMNDDDDDFFCGMVVTDERRLALFPAGTIVRDPHHCESLTCREQDMNLRRIWVQA